MSSNIIDLRISLQISEPWNFKMPSGSNTVSGIIEGFCPLPKESYLKGGMILVSLEEEIDWENAKAKQLLLSSRYEGQPIFDIVDGKSVTVNVARVKQPYVLRDGDKIESQQIEDFAIGAIRKA